MKKYLSFFNIRFVNSLQYRAAAITGVVTQFAWGIMTILLFSAFYKTDASSFPMTFNQLASYIWMQQAFLALFMTWYFDTDVLESISTGNIAYELVRPIDIYNMWFTKNYANRLAKAVLRCLPIIIVAIFLPYPYNLAPPPSLEALLLTILTIFLGTSILIALSMLVCISTFYTVNNMGVRMVFLFFAEFLSGAIIPLPFFPDYMQTFINLTPFAAIQNIPFRIYVGHITGAAMYEGLALQFIWLFISIIVGRLWLKKSLKKVIVQGG